MAAGSGESGWSPAFSLTLPDLRCLLRSEAEEADPLSKKKKTRPEEGSLQSRERGGAEEEDESGEGPSEEDTGETGPGWMHGSAALCPPCPLSF